MKRLILLFIFSLVCLSGFAQKMTPEEKAALKAEKQAQRLERRKEREEMRRIQDSLWQANYNYMDTLGNAKRKKDESTDIVAIVPMSAAAALDRVAKELIRATYIIEVNKEYGTIKTEPVHAGMANYTLYFSVEGSEEQSTIRACAFGHGSAGVAMYGIVRTHEVTMKLNYRGMEGSTQRAAFDAIESILKGFEGAVLSYEKL